MIAGQLELVLMANIARLSDDMRKAESTVSTAMGKIDGAVGMAKNALGALGIGLSVNHFAKMIQGAIDAQDALGKMSQRTGVSVEALNGLGHAANLSGTSLDTVQKALKTVSNGMVDAQRGMAGAQENFAALGISVTDSTGALKSADAVMIEVAEKFEHMKDGTEKAAIATKLFGRAGLDLIPMLNEGSEGLAAMVREGQRLNPVTTQSAANAEIFNDNMDRLKGSMGGFVTQIANSALPVMADWTQALLDTITATDKLITAQDDYLENIGTLTKEQIAANIQATSQDIEAKKKQLAITEALARSAVGFSGKLAEQRAELERLESGQRVNIAQLGKLNAGYKPVTASTEELTEATETLSIVTAEQTAEVQAAAKALADHQKKVRDTITELAGQQAQLYMTGKEQAIYNAMVDLGSDATAEEQRNIIALTAALYDQEEATKAAGDEWDAMVKELEAVGKKQVSDAEAATAQVTKAQEQAAEQTRRDWERTHDFLSETFVDIFDNGGSAFEKLGDAAVATAKRIVAEWLAMKAMNLFGIPTPGSVGGGGGAASSIIGSIGSSAIGRGVSNVVGGLFGGGAAAGAATAGTGVAAAGSANAAIAAVTGTGAAGSGALASIGGALAAVPGWGWALAGGAALAGLLAEDSTPSSNAGFLMKDVPGASADRKFDVAPFASGFDPVGFARRESQGSAIQIIDTFRAYDAALTEMARSVGYSVNYDWTNFAGMGTSETGQGAGVFVGSASEDGTLNSSAVSSQVDQYVRLWIEGLGSQIGPNAKSQILAAGSADAMLAKAAELTAGVHGSHATGLSYVPFDGYRAELHKGERVQTASEARNSDSGMAAMAAKLDAVVAELRSIKGSTSGTYTMLRNLSPDGQSLQTVAA